MKTLTIALTHFTFRGTVSKADAYAQHLLHEARTAARRNDWSTVAAIDADLARLDQKRPPVNQTPITLTYYSDSANQVYQLDK